MKKSTIERLREALRTIECPNGCGCEEFCVEAKFIDASHCVMDRDGNEVEDWRSGDNIFFCYRIFCENCEDDPYIVEIK